MPVVYGQPYTATNRASTNRSFAVERRADNWIKGNVGLIRAGLIIGEVLISLAFGPVGKAVSIALWVSKQLISGLAFAAADVLVSIANDDINGWSTGIVFSTAFIPLISGLKEAAKLGKAVKALDPSDLFKSQSAFGKSLQANIADHAKSSNASVLESNHVAQGRDLIYDKQSAYSNWITKQINRNDDIMSNSLKQKDVLKSQYGRANLKINKRDIKNQARAFTKKEIRTKRYIEDSKKYASIGGEAKLFGEITGQEFTKNFKAPIKDSYYNFLGSKATKTIRKTRSIHKFTKKQNIQALKEYKNSIRATTNLKEFNENLKELSLATKSKNVKVELTGKNIKGKFKSVNEIYGDSYTKNQQDLISSVYKNVGEASFPDEIKAVSTLSPQQARRRLVQIQKSNENLFIKSQNTLVGIRNSKLSAGNRIKGARYSQSKRAAKREFNKQKWINDKARNLNTKRYITKNEIIDAKYRRAEARIAKFQEIKEQAKAGIDLAQRTGNWSNVNYKLTTRKIKYGGNGGVIDPTHIITETGDELGIRAARNQSKRISDLNAGQKELEKILMVQKDKFDKIPQMLKDAGQHLDAKQFAATFGFKVDDIQKQIDAVQKIRKIVLTFKKGAFVNKNVFRRELRQIVATKNAGYMKYDKFIYRSFFNDFDYKYIAKQALVASQLRGVVYNNKLIQLGLSVDAQKAIKQTITALTVSKHSLKKVNHYIETLYDNLGFEDMRLISEAYGSNFIRESLLELAPLKFANHSSGVVRARQTVRYLGSSKFNRVVQGVQALFDPNDLGRWLPEVLYQYGGRKFDRFLNRKFAKQLAKAKLGAKQLSKRINKNVVLKFENALLNSGFIPVKPNRYLFAYRVLTRNPKQATKIVELAFKRENTAALYDTLSKNYGGKDNVRIICTDNDIDRLREEGADYYWRKGKRKGWYLSRGGRSRSSFSALHRISTKLSLFLGFIPIAALTYSLSLVSNIVDALGDISQGKYFNTYLSSLEGAAYRASLNRSTRFGTRILIGRTITKVLKANGTFNRITNTTASKVSGLLFGKTLGVNGLGGLIGRETQRYSLTLLRSSYGKTQSGRFKFKNQKQFSSAVRSGFKKAPLTSLGSLGLRAGRSNYAFAAQNRISTRRKLSRSTRITSSFTPPGIRTLSSLTRF